ncbi:MAG: SAM-dependent methyltransferase [Pseudomonadota bacterium]
MTPLEALIRQEITATGPMTVARYMELCLTHPQHGYYVTRDPFGMAGDFITAPEVSQMFGEIVGAWTAAAWIEMGRPAFKLVELGAGRGTLMADVLRVLRRAGGSPEVWFVEVSQHLQEEQARRVSGAEWVKSLDQVPDGPAVYLANEFFDALPVRQFLCAEDGWHERVIGLQEDRLIWGLAPSAGGQVGSVGDWRERAQQAHDVVNQLALRLARAPGAALICDYGYRQKDRPDGLTLQAVRRHERADPLCDPGQADLTWLIDFDVFQELYAAKGCAVRVTSQAGFLTELGIGQRAEVLANASRDKADAIADALERLTSPEQMGTLFKVLGAVSPGLELPPGFEST